MISLVGLNKASVLAVLYNASKPQGMGFMHYDPAPMEHEKAERLLEMGTYFDYLKGRVMKVDLSSDELDPRGYDRDNGQGTAERVIQALRDGEDVDGLTVSSAHTSGKAESIRSVREQMGEPSTVEKGDGYISLTLGLSGVADKLSKKVDEAENL